MKAITHILKTIAALFILLLTSSNLSAQQNALKLKPLSFEFAFERQIANQFSVQLAARAFPFGINVDAEDNADDFGLSLNEYQLTPELRFYAFKKMGPLQGFFIAPHAKVGMMRLKGTATSENDLEGTAVFKGKKWGAGLTMGWQWVNEKGLSIDTQIGFGYTRRYYDGTNVNYSDGTSEFTESGLESIGITAPRIGFSIGYAF